MPAVSYLLKTQKPLKHYLIVKYSYCDYKVSPVPQISQLKLPKPMSKTQLQLGLQQNKNKNKNKKP